MIRKKLILDLKTAVIGVGNSEGLTLLYCSTISTISQDEALQEEDDSNEASEAAPSSTISLNTTDTPWAHIAGSSNTGQPLVVVTLNLYQS